MTKKKPVAKIIDYRRITMPPQFCPKCGLDYFIPHEDGWQCWHCMKIIYSRTPILTSPSERSR